MGKNKELENIKVHMDMLLTDDICEDAVISKKDHDLHFQIFRLLTGYGELLEKIKYGSTAQPTTRPMTAEERKQWACEHRDEYWFTYKELGHHPEGFHMHTFADRYKPLIEDGQTVVASPHKVYGPDTNDLVLQLRKRGVDKVILAGMSANLCVEAHLRELTEQPGAAGEQGRPPGNAEREIDVGEHRSDEADHRRFVREDADHAAATLDLLVESLERVRRPDFLPVGLRERREREHLVLR